jgi:acid phosphatase
MTNDGHDSSVTVAGAWAKSFLTPLLTNPNFASNTLVVLTFDECETYLTPNRIWGLLLGDAVPAALAGTTDSTFYDHYSQLSTVEANWGLDTLGRFDVGANVYKFVADQTGDVVRAWENPPFDKVQLQSSYPGLFNSVDKNVPFPAPNVSAVYSGRSVLPAIADLWSGDQADSYYTTAVEIPDGEYHPVYHG